MSSALSFARARPGRRAKPFAGFPADSWLWLPGPDWCFSDTNGHVKCKAGDSVYVWKDWTGRYTFTQSTSGSRPTLQKVSNRWTLRHDGTNDYMTADAALIAKLSSPAGLSWGGSLQMTSLTRTTGTKVFLRANQAGGTTSSLWGWYYADSHTSHARSSGGTFTGVQFARAARTIYSATSWDLAADTVYVDCCGHSSSVSGATGTPGAMTALDVGRDPSAGLYGAFDLYGLALGNTTWPASTRRAVSAYFRLNGPAPQNEAAFVSNLVDVWTSGTGYNTYRIPAVCNYNGTIVAVCEGRASTSDGGNIDLVCKTSSDNGSTWGSNVVARSNGTDTAGNPVLIADVPRGKIHLIFCQQLASDTNNGHGATTRTCWYTSSSDTGATWATPVEITSQVADMGTWSWLACGPGQGVLLPSGRIVVSFVHSDAAYGNPYFKDHVCYSDDGGATWTRGAAIGPVGTNETAITAITSTSIMLSARPGNGTSGRYISTSTDSGATWPANGTADPRILGTPTQGSILQISGKLCHSWIPDSVSRQGLSIATSTGDGTTYERQSVIDPGPSAYSCLVDLGSNQVGCLYEWGAAVGTYSGIRFAVLDLY